MLSRGENVTTTDEGEDDSSDDEREQFHMAYDEDKVKLEKQQEEAME